MSCSSKIGGENKSSSIVAMNVSEITDNLDSSRGG